MLFIENELPINFSLIPLLQLTGLKNWVSYLYAFTYLGIAIGNLSEILVPYPTLL